MGERSLEQDILNDIQSRQRLNEQGGVEVDNPIGDTVNPNDLQLVQNFNTQHDLNGQPVEYTGYGGMNFMQGEGFGDSGHDTSNTAASEGFGDPNQSSVADNIEVEDEQIDDGIGEDGLLIKTCQRCRGLRKGCDRQRPCRRCKSAGLSADECLPQVNVRRVFKISRHQDSSPGS